MRYFSLQFFCKININAILEHFTKLVPTYAIWSVIILIESID